MAAARASVSTRIYHTVNPAAATTLSTLHRGPVGWVSALSALEAPLEAPALLAPPDAVVEAPAVGERSPDFRTCLSRFVTLASDCQATLSPNQLHIATRCERERSQIIGI